MNKVSKCLAFAIRTRFPGHCFVFLMVLWLTDPKLTRRCSGILSTVNTSQHMRSLSHAVFERLRTGRVARRVQCANFTSPLTPLYWIAHLLPFRPIFVRFSSAERGRCWDYKGNSPILDRPLSSHRLDLGTRLPCPGTDAKYVNAWPWLITPHPRLLVHP